MNIAKTAHGERVRQIIEDAERQENHIMLIGVAIGALVGIVTTVWMIRWVRIGT